jgi:hypothetical protein
MFTPVQEYEVNKILQREMSRRYDSKASNQLNEAEDGTNVKSSGHAIFESSDDQVSSSKNKPTASREDEERTKRLNYKRRFYRRKPGECYGDSPISRLYNVFWWRRIGDDYIIPDGVQIDENAKVFYNNIKFVKLLSTSPDFDSRTTDNKDPKHLVSSRMNKDERAFATKLVAYARQWMYSHKSFDSVDYTFKTLLPRSMYSLWASFWLDERQISYLRDNLRSVQPGSSRRKQKHFIEADGLVFNEFQLRHRKQATDFFDNL